MPRRAVARYDGLEMELRPVLILTALHFEARPIARELGLNFISQNEAAGAIAGRAVRLVIAGPGLQFLPSDVPGGCELVLMAGLGGGLSADLKRGDVVVDDQSNADCALDASRGPIATIKSLAATPAEKQALRLATGALVVDMENAIARDWAHKLGVRFIGVRVVSDTAAETLDPATLRIVDAKGFLSIGRLIKEIAYRPLFLVSLWRLRNTGRCVAILAASVKQVLSALKLVEAKP